MVVLSECALSMLSIAQPQHWSHSALDRYTRYMYTALGCHPDLRRPHRPLLNQTKRSFKFYFMFYFQLCLLFCSHFSNEWKDRWLSGVGPHATAFVKNQNVSELNLTELRSQILIPAAPQLHLSAEPQLLRHPSLPCSDWISKCWKPIYELILDIQWIFSLNKHAKPRFDRPVIVFIMNEYPFKSIAQ